ncbi:Radical SAM domain protein [Olavius sp. associated proteobacterium Delta 1]|nr:Radical SAM domain protein [Olavius sp. associated proteobacterium Delta 1]
MKMLLIYPYFLNTRVYTTEDVRPVPLGVYYVAAVLKDNRYDVEILNWHNINATPHKIRQALEEKKPDIIGFSILTANRWGGIEIARIARQINPQVKIVFGGIGATFLWEHFLTHFQEVDFVVIGEGEHTFLKLIRCLETNRPQAIEKIKGVAFRKNGKPIRTPEADPIERLDDLPDPAKYFDFQHLALTRGCGGNCNFCGSPRFWGRKVRFHSADYFVGQLERLFHKGIHFFYFSDDTFTAHKRRVIEICRKIIEKKLDIAWNAISRVDHVSEQVLYWMRKAGCIQISYGVESGSEKIRKFLLKNISSEKIQSAFALTRKYGIMARAYFIYGAPQESRQTIQETIDLINTIKPLSAIFYILDIFPGTALYEDFKQRLNATDDIWLNRIEDIMYFETDPDLTREMILAFGQKLRSSFYKNLPGFVETIRLIDSEDLYPQHSRFYARLAMTFDHGDYSANDVIENKDRLVEKLYRLSLNYYPNAEAYLGLGIHNQKRGAPQDAIDILSHGLAHFPNDARLNICLGVGLMNLADYDQALARFLEFPDEKDAVQFAARCYEALGDDTQAATFMGKYNKM